MLAKESLQGHLDMAGVHHFCDQGSEWHTEQKGVIFRRKLSGLEVAMGPQRKGTVQVVVRGEVENRGSSAMTEEL